jgi:hypothetical protein
MAAAKPWMKFYPRDWRADEKLRDCSLAARGLWIEMLAIMHASERYGRLLIGGTAPSAARLARQVGTSESEVETLLAELGEAGVYSTDAAGIIYSRRMKSDEKIAENARKVGKRGGNPKLLKQTENPAQDKGEDNATDKAGDKLRGQRPEYRVPPNPQPATRIPDDVRAVLDAGGYVGVPGDLTVLRQWYAAGADLSDVVKVVRREAANMLARHGPPRTLKVFDTAIREQLAADQREIEHLRKVARRNMPEQQAAAGGAG